jgi:hypothetical protein
MARSRRRSSFRVAGCGRTSVSRLVTPPERNSRPIADPAMCAEYGNGRVRMSHRHDAALSDTDRAVPDVRRPPRTAPCLRRSRRLPLVGVGDPPVVSAVTATSLGATPSAARCRLGSTMLSSFGARDAGSRSKTRFTSRRSCLSGRCGWRHASGRTWRCGVPPVGSNLVYTTTLDRPERRRIHGQRP